MSSPPSSPELSLHVVTAFGAGCLASASSRLRHFELPRRSYTLRLQLRSFVHCIQCTRMTNLLALVYERTVRGVLLLLLYALCSRLGPRPPQPQARTMACPVLLQHAARADSLRVLVSGMPLATTQQTSRPLLSGGVEGGLTFRRL